METRFFEEKYFQWLIFPRSRFICEITVTDAGSFGMIFSTATTRLREWFEKNQGSASEFELRLSATPLVFERAQSAMCALLESGGGYHFVKKLKLTIVFQNVENGAVEYYVCDGA